ncbi:thiamine diphosphokinase [Paracoccaceae bacterium GXU_MW_L88]
MTPVLSAPSITLMGAGAVTRADAEDALRHAPVLVCADGGADHAARFDLVADAVIGDLDSASAAAQEAAGAKLHHISEQESTDFEKCLMATEAEIYLGVGFLGGRLDHSLAALNAMVRRREKILLIGAEDVMFHVPQSVALDLPKGSRVSLFAMDEVTGTECAGLSWDVTGLTFAPNGKIGTSNKMDGSALRLSFDKPGMLLLLPRAALDEAVRALRAMPV